MCGYKNLTKPTDLRWTQRVYCIRLGLICVKSNVIYFANGIHLPSDNFPMAWPQRPNPHWPSSGARQKRSALKPPLNQQLLHVARPHINLAHARVAVSATQARLADLGYEIRVQTIIDAFIIHIRRYLNSL